MSWFNPTGKPSIKPRPAPIIRKVTRPVQQSSRSNGLNGANATSTPPRPAPSRSKTTLSSSAQRNPRRRAGDSDRSTALRKAAKPKSATPEKLFSSGSESESEDDFSLDRPQKRRRGDTHSPELSRRRRIRDLKLWSDIGGDDSSFVHSVELFQGERAKNYAAAFDVIPETSSWIAAIHSGAPLVDHRMEVALSYPGSSQQERFPLLVPSKDQDDYRPLTDMVESIAQVLQEYLPASESKPLLDESTGMIFRLTKAAKHRDSTSFVDTINTYNALITKLRKNGVIATTMDSKPTLHFDLVEQIMRQVFERTVSPRAESLRKYASFSDFTYGEILPKFASQIFRNVRLTPSSVFLDLGSGVGSVVLQAALECGCESWGIEFMPTPCELAELQAAEFRARARLWGISVGAVQVLKGDFFDDARLGEVLERADVILVNNQAFSSETNDKLLSRFLDVKEGARIVSLKSFVPASFQLTTRTSEDPRAALDVRQLEYWQGCVSWKDEGGEYFVATMDRGRLGRFQEGVAGG